MEKLKEVRGERYYFVHDELYTWATYDTEKKIVLINKQLFWDRFPEDTDEKKAEKIRSLLTKCFKWDIKAVLINKKDANT